MFTDFMDLKPKILPETAPGDYDNGGSNKITLNNDVLIEILLWLPAKALIRFKLVCKRWLSLISASQFCRRHTLRHPKPHPSLILHVQTSPFLYFHPILNDEKLIPYSFNFPNPIVLSSCSGLLLLQCNQPHKEYYVYNPTTKQLRRINLTDNDKYTDVLGLNLVFDPSKSLHYKIVCVRATKQSPSPRRRCCQIEVYESESRTWKLCLEPFTASIHVKFSSGVHCKNVIHWDSHPFAHLFFDIDKNVVGNLPHAQIPWTGSGRGAACYCQLQELNGHLYHFIIVSDQGDKSIAVLELSEDYSKWLLKYHDGFGRAPGAFRILSFVGGDGEESCTLVFHVPGKITAYRFFNKGFKELVNLTNQPFYRGDAVQFEPANVYQFGESLVPV